MIFAARSAHMAGRGRINGVKTKFIPIVSVAGWAIVSSVRAQVEAPPAPVIVAPPPAIVVQPAPAVIEAIPAPGEHFVDIELAVSRGSVQAYFGRAARNEKVEIGDAKLIFKAPSTLTVTKLASRDKDAPGSQRVTPDNPWVVRVPFAGPGRYVFNIVEWDDDPVVTAAVVKLDGAVLFSGRGSEDDLNGWAVKNFGAGVNKTGSREIAFVVP